jgi:hypothetical protein
MATQGNRMNSSTACANASSATLGIQHNAPANLDTNEPMQSRDSHRKGGSNLKLRDLWPAFALFFVGMMALLIATLSPSGKDGQYAVVAPPWYRLGDTVTLIQKADGGIVDMGGPANIIIAHSENPDFVRALYSAGAWLVVDPMKLRGCVGFRSEAQ